jgi:precorrin-2 dehydrogenase/sirohydrochlorin ferrochelatase
MAMNLLYPIFLDVTGRRCLVVGGGIVAERKVRALIECGAHAILVAPKITPGIKSLASEKRIEHTKDEFAPSHLDGMFLVIAATDNEAVNQNVFEEANRKGIPCNVVDRPETSSFHVPTQLQRGHLKIAISTNGKSPGFARQIRTWLESLVGEGFSEALEFLSQARELVKERYPDAPERRMEAMKELAESEAFLRAARENDYERLKAVFQEWTSSCTD